MKDPRVDSPSDLLAADDPQLSPRAPSRRSRIDEEFALLMTSCAHVVRLPASVDARADVATQRPAEIWRRSDSAMTGGTGVESTAPAPPPKTASFVTQVVHKELGPMEVTVERRDDSVRVLFQVTDAVAKVALETQRSALLASLHAAGVQVASVVIAVKSGGIALAPRVSVTGTKNQKSARAEEDQAPSSADDRGGLNLVG